MGEEPVARLGRDDLEAWVEAVRLVSGRDPAWAVERLGAALRDVHGVLAEWAGTVLPAWREVDPWLFASPPDRVHRVKGEAVAWRDGRWRRCVRMDGSWAWAE